MNDAIVNVKELSAQALLRTFGSILSELRQRGLVRSSNNPVADYAEHLVATALRLQLATASTTGHDAVDAEGNRYEIKARRLTTHNVSRQLSAIRGLDKEHFTHLVAVLFTDDFEVFRAALIPREVVCQRAIYKAHVNAWVLHVPDAVWGCEGVRDVTAELRGAQQVGASVTLAQVSTATPAPDSESGSQAVASHVAAKPPKVSTRRTQRDVMRGLVKRLGLDREAVVAAYADAELRGEALRIRDARGIDAETYARALWADGVEKGWF